MSCVICQNFLGLIFFYSPACSNSVCLLKVQTQFLTTVILGKTALRWFLGKTALSIYPSLQSHGPLFFEKRKGIGGEMWKRLGERRKECLQSRVGKGSQLPLHAAAFLKALHSHHQRITSLPTKKMKTFINNQPQTICVYV